MDTLNIFKNKNLSLWLKDSISSTLSKLEKDIDCDICIVGAGISGITTAYMLNELGYKVVLIDKDIPVHLTSGNTTAKFTFQHGLIYSEILKKYGLEKAKLYYESQLDGLNLVRTLIKRHNISCDFKEASSIIYGEDEKDFKKILIEKSLYEKLVIPHELTDYLPFNIKGIGGLKVDSQFELNPVKYLDSLIKYLLEKDVSIFKDTAAKYLVKDGENIKVVTDNNDIITCKNLVISTGYPFFGANGLYFTRLEAYRSYLLAFPTKEPLDDSYMMISNSQTPYSLRFSDTDGVHYLLVGGQGHKVGQVNSERESYKKLIDFAKNNFKVDDPVYRWSAQDYRSVDKIPYIGNLTSKYRNIFVATGFNKWGMSNGSFASILISDLIKGRDSKYKELFNPSRDEVKHNFNDFIKSNLNVAKELIKGKTLPDEISLKDIQNDEGGIIKYKGKRVAAYRDTSGTLFLSDSTCTHLGCELEYNNAERSFDCPCHGSRFNFDGTVLEGAATKNLKKVDI